MRLGSKNTKTVMDRLGTMAVKENPYLKEMVDDPKIRSWMNNYWRYVQETERGNEPTFKEMKSEGYYSTYLDDVRSGNNDLMLGFLNEMYDNGDRSSILLSLLRSYPDVFGRYQGTRQ